MSKIISPISNPMASNQPLVVIMAGGQGKRFGPGKIKVLQEILGKPMLVHIISTAQNLAPKKILVIVGVYKDVIEKTLVSFPEIDMSKVSFVNQLEPKGTGHALQCCIPEFIHLEDPMTKVLILSGDTPLMQLATMASIVNKSTNATITVRQADNPKGCGRVILVPNTTQFDRIVEEKDASPSERLIDLVNCGVYCIRADYLVSNLPALTNNNAQQEYYITDVIKLIKDNEKVDIDLYKIPKENDYEVMGVNTPEEMETLIARYEILVA
jgi:bifunctional UDP-N-acetylglucosamine pyrophosphorylase / glucosamine-1-phosphate N-acetyltransferase